MRAHLQAIKTASELKEASRLNPKVASLRIAYLWVKRASDALLDLMFRLSMLEGAAEVSPGRWSDNPNRGIKQASDHFSGTRLDPSWLTKDDTGLYGRLLSLAESLMRSSGVEGVAELAPDEVLINAYMGLRRGGGGRKTRLLYEAGKSLGDKIPSGQETPRSAYNKASRFIKNKVLDEIKIYQRDKARHRLDYGDEGETGDRGIADKGLWEKSKGEFFSRTLLDPSDRLGERIRRWIRDFFSKQKGSKYLLSWLDQSLKKGRPATQVEVAEEFGIAATGLGRYFKPALSKLESAFWRSSLADELEDAFVAEGGRLASNRRASRLALRYLFRSFFRPVP